jgi:hypothetical protein
MTSDFRYTPQSVSLIRRHARTMAPVTIAAFMHCSISMVESICKKHNIDIRAEDAFVRNPGPPTPEDKIVRKSLEIQVDEAALRIVRKQARQRGVDTHTLIELLIERVAEDDLVSAVLDR